MVFLSMLLPWRNTSLLWSFYLNVSLGPASLGPTRGWWNGPPSGPREHSEHHKDVPSVLSHAAAEHMAPMKPSPLETKRLPCQHTDVCIFLV